MAAPRRSPHDPDPTVTRLRAGDVDPSSGRRVPGRGSDGPRHVDGTPMTEEEIRAELEAEPRRPWDSRRPAASRPKTVRPGRRGGARGGRGRGGRPSWSPATLGGRALAPLRGETDATGFVLALIVWGWIALPMLQGGPNAVRDVARAKFTNRGRDGKWLP